MVAVLKLLQPLRVAGTQGVRKLRDFSLIGARGCNAVLLQPALLARLISFLRALRYRRAVEVIDPHDWSVPLSPS